MREASMAATARKIVSSDDRAARSEFSRDVLDGLKRTPKAIPPKYFYDSEGSRLFEQITRLADYYPTRSEIEILRAHASEIAALIPERAALVEFGSGSSVKARILLDAAPHIAAYVPVDVSADYLAQEAQGLREDYPRLRVLPLAADFAARFALPAEIDAFPHAGFFPGSTIGNFEPHEAYAFLQNTRGILGRESVLIVGVDLEKSAQVLNAAYNDGEGVTEKFNLNLLNRINRELGADFDPSSFEHHAFYNRERHRIEMHLASVRRQKVKVAGEVIDFRAGETIHTENSYKYTPSSFVSLVRGAGWRPLAMWTDRRKYFSVHALRAD
jgi:dimethylhistidine N-methyltransferase